MKAFRFSGAALGALALAACSTAGPNYRPPENAVATLPDAQGEFVSGGHSAFSQEYLPDRWWSLYDDPRLDALVEEALLANADLRVAEGNLQVADAIVREAVGNRALSTSIGANTTLENDYSSTSMGTSFPGLATFDLGLTFNYPLDIKGKLKRAIEGSLADREAVEAARDAVRIAVAAATAKAYANVCAANYQMVTVRKVIQLQRETLNATQRLQRGGRGTAFDVSRARTAVETSEANLPALVAKRQASLYTLAALMGKPPALYPRDVETCAQLPRLARAMPIGDGAGLIRRRPDIRQAERVIAADTARIGVAMADLYPSVSIAGGLLTDGLFENVGKAHSFGFSLGPLLSWSFPHRPIVKARIAAAEARVQTDIAHFDAKVLDALRSTETALETYARDRERTAALARAAQSAALSAEQANKLFLFGRADFLNLLNAQANLAAARVNHAAAEASLVDNQISVFLALGGGWKQSEQPTARGATPDNATTPIQP